MAGAVSSARVTAALVTFERSLEYQEARRLSRWPVA